jgi:hypothetical protein
MVSISKVFIRVIFDYLSFNHLWNLLKLCQNPYWKMLLLVCMVKSLWKSYKKNPIKSIRIKTHLDISIMYPLGTKNLRKKKSFQKDF